MYPMHWRGVNSGVSSVTYISAAEKLTPDQASAWNTWILLLNVGKALQEFVVMVLGKPQALLSPSLVARLSKQALIGDHIAFVPVSVLLD